MSEDSMSTVFFPLKSNVEWFQCADLRQSIEERLKHAILLYDEILIEDGTYIAEITEDGNFCSHYPSGTLPDEHRGIEYERDIKPGDLQVGLQMHGGSRIQSIIQGPTVARYKIDYHELLGSIGEDECDFIRRINLDRNKFPKEAKDAIRDQTREDRRKLSSAHAVKQIRDLFLGNLNEDLITSTLLRSAVVLDPRHADILKLKCAGDSGLQFSPKLEELAFKRLMSLVVPDLSGHSMADILSLRDSRLWIELRRFLSNLVSGIHAAPDILLDAERVASLLDDKIVRALFAELRESYPTPKQLAIDVGMGLTSMIPGFGLIPSAASVAKTTWDYYGDRSGWFAFLMRLEN